MGKYILYHSAPNIIESFDIRHFKENSLINDTKEFGIYFNFVDYKLKTNPINKIMMQQCADYGLRKSDNHTAYMHISTLKINDESLLSSNGLMSEPEFCDLVGDLCIDCSKYNMFKNNQQIITAVVSYLRNRGFEWYEIADYLTEKGYYGHIRGKSSGFGQLTLWSTDRLFMLDYLEIVGYTEFKNKNDLELDSPIKLLK
jgi:hypothetical protein